MNSASCEGEPLSFLDQIHKPERSERDIRSCLLPPESREGYLESQQAKATALNHEEAARQLAALARNEIADLGQELVKIERDLRWIPAVVARSVEGERIGGAKKSLAILLSAIGLLSMCTGVAIMSEYALQSASPLFTRPYAAFLYASLPAFFAICVKTYEATIVSPYAKRIFATVWFALSSAAFSVWLFSSSIALAPDLAVSLALTTEAPDAKLVGKLMLVSTVLAELGISYTILACVSRLLAPKQDCESIANPVFEALAARKANLKREIADCQFLRVRAENYLVRVAAIREVTRQEARRDIARAEELLLQAERMGLSVASAVFFRTGEEES